MVESLEDVGGEIAGAVITGASKSIADLVDNYIKGIASGVSGYVRKRNMDNSRGYEAYFKAIEERCRSTKTLINREEAVSVVDIYEPLIFNKSSNDEEDIISQIEISDNLFKGGKIVLNGIGGSGKTMSVKTTLLQSRNNEKLPIFIELRHVDYSKNDSIIEFIVTNIRKNVPGFDVSDLEYGLKNGYFTLFFDGFDEIASAWRDSAQEQILKLGYDFPLAGIMVSGRPDQRYAAWHNFDVLKAAPLNMEQVCGVVLRSKYEDSKKSRFVQRVKNELFDSHRDLLANPLLVYMMLMTVFEFPDLPKSTYIYYERAFEVLQERHDAQKANFERDYASGLDPRDFKKTFEVFCFLSYIDGHTDFDSEKIVDRYCSEALEYENLDVESKKFLSDVIGNVCVMQKEGDYYSFLHRSFQEYFIASFLLSRHLDNFRGIVGELVNQHRERTVLKFMQEMNSEIIERMYIIPALSHMKKTISRMRSQVRICKKFCSDWDYDSGEFHDFWVLGDNEAEFASELFTFRYLFRERFPFKIDANLTPAEEAIMGKRSAVRRGGSGKVEEEKKAIVEKYKIGDQYRNWIGETLGVLEKAEDKRATLRNRGLSLRRSLLRAKSG